MSPGGILGHEFVGVVEAAGGGVRRFAEGDRVVGSFTIPCGDVLVLRAAACSAGVPISACSGTARSSATSPARRRSTCGCPNADLVLHGIDDVDERRAGALRRRHLHDRVRLRERGTHREGRRRRRASAAARSASWPSSASRQLRAVDDLRGRHGVAAPGDGAEPRRHTGGRQRGARRRASSRIAPAAAARTRCSSASGSFRRSSTASTSLAPAGGSA